MKKLTPEMLEHAEQGGLFKFWNEDGIEISKMFSYYDFSITPFQRRGNMQWYSNAEIYVPKKKVKSCVDTMKALINGGWKPNEKGVFIHDVKSLAFDPVMWQYCSKEESNIFHWDPSWLEDVE